VYRGCTTYLDSGVVISDLEGNNPRLISGPGCAGLHWNADGRTLLCSFKHQLLLVDLDTEKFTVAQNFDLSIDIGNISILEQRPVARRRSHLPATRPLTST
jgi:hypothetical protein